MRASISEFEKLDELKASAEQAAVVINRERYINSLETGEEYVPIRVDETDEWKEYKKLYDDIWGHPGTPGLTGSSGTAGINYRRIGNNFINNYKKQQEKYRRRFYR